jgi:FKBP-type peptidyl-prolyl cis-trans isomerase FkpA
VASLNFVIKQQLKNIINMRIFPLLLLLTLVLSSCLKKDNQPEIDDQIIQNYLKKNNLTATKHPSGLYYIMTQEGTGDSPNISNTVEVKYQGRLTDGTVFDETETDKTASFELSGLIYGWQIGITMMKKGGKATLFIPSGLGYGNNEIGPIPPNSVLIFDIELVDFK